MWAPNVEGAASSTDKELHDFLASFSTKEGFLSMEMVPDAMRLLSCDLNSVAQLKSYFTSFLKCTPEDARSQMEKDMREALTCLIETPQYSEGSPISGFRAGMIGRHLYEIFRSICKPTDGLNQSNDGVTAQGARSARSTQDAFHATVVVIGEDGKKHKVAAPGCKDGNKRDPVTKRNIYAILDNHLNNGNLVLAEDGEVL